MIQPENQLEARGGLHLRNSRLCGPVNTVSVGLAALFALVLHGALWVNLKTDGAVQERARSLARRLWIVVGLFTGLITVLTLRIQPQVAANLSDHAWGWIFPALAVAGWAGSRWWLARNDTRAFLASCAYLIGLLAAVRDKSKSDVVRRRVLEAASPICLPEVAESIMAAYRSADHKMKVSAIYAMGKNCDPAWLNILLTELESPDAEIRYEAAKACGELGEEESVPHLIKLAQESDIDIQLAAVQALGQIGGTEAKNYLEDCLDDPNELIQQAAEQALKEIEMGEEPFSF